MGLSDIISTVTNGMFNGGHMNVTRDESVAYTRLKRKSAHKFPVIYESHEPLALCYDIPLSEKTRISKEELKTYNDLDVKINIHNTNVAQAIVLYDTVSFTYEYPNSMPNSIYTLHARSRGLIYTAHNERECKLNANRLRRNTQHVSLSSSGGYFYMLGAHLSPSMSFLAYAITEIPVDMLKIARGTLGNIYFKPKSVSETLNKLNGKDTSFVFNINGYEVKTHNVNIIYFNTQRILTPDRRVRAMCVSVEFGGKSGPYVKHTSIEYTNIRNGLHYTTDIMKYDNQYNPPIIVHDGLIKAVNIYCDPKYNRPDTTTTTTTQKTTRSTTKSTTKSTTTSMTTSTTTSTTTSMTVSTAVVNVINTQNNYRPYTTDVLPTQSTVTLSGNTQNNYRPYTTDVLPTQSTVTLSGDNIMNLSVGDIVASVFVSLLGLGIVATILFASFKCYARKCFGVIPLRNTHNVNNNDDNHTEAIEMQALHIEPQEEEIRLKITDETSETKEESSVLV